MGGKAGDFFATEDAEFSERNGGQSGGYVGSAGWKT